MLYSILPVYIEEQSSEYVQLDYKGYHVLACKTPEGFVLERLYDTDPQNFMSPDLQPGLLLENRLINRIIQ